MLCISPQNLTTFCKLAQKKYNLLEILSICIFAKKKHTPLLGKLSYSSGKGARRRLRILSVKPHLTYLNNSTLKFFKVDNIF